MRAIDLLNEEDRGDIDGTIMDEDINVALQAKWSGLLEGIEDTWTRRCMARLFENQMGHLETMKRRHLTESTLAQNIPDLVKFAFPVVRKVWANILANGLFSIQPMSSPIGGIFYWDYKYGTTKGTITAGDDMIDNFDRNYSSEFVEEEVIGAGPGTNFTGTVAWKPVKGYGLGQVGIEFLGINAGGDTLRIYDADGSGTLTGDTGGASTITLSTGVYDITFSASVTAVTANYFFNMEGVADNVPQVNVDIQLEAIKAGARKLKVLWSSEAADDMRAVLNMDVEPELTQGIASEIALGIDREMIMCAYGSGTTNIAAFDAAVPPGRNQVDHFRNIMTPLEKVSGGINTATHRGPGNFIVTGPSLQPVFGALATNGDLVRVFDNLPTPSSGQGTGGRPAFPLPQSPSGYGIYPMGFLQNKWTVIIDPYFPSGKIMVGLKGPMFTDSGLVYAPYIPLEMTAAFLDPADFTLRKGMRTRYAKKLVNNRFFAKVNVTNLP